MLPTHRAPSHPGEVLAAEFLAPLGMTQQDLARGMGVPFQRVNLIVNEKRGITAETALLLARELETTPLFWLNLQVAWDLWEAQHSSRLVRRAPTARRGARAAGPSPARRSR